MSGRILTVSNRGPIEFHLDDGGGLRTVPGQGGLSTALRVAATFAPTTWLSSPLTATDREIATGGLDAGDLARNSRFVLTDQRAYDLFYGRFANEVLWFIQHSMQWPDSLTPPRIEEAWTDGYRVVNQVFADAIVKDLDTEPADAVLFHDYHFYLAPAMVRSRRPDVYLQQFVHIPWPEPAQWLRLDAAILSDLCRGLIANDSLVFQSRADVENFLLTVQTAVPDASVDIIGGRVVSGGRTTRVWANGISADPDELREEAMSDDFARYRYILRGEPEEKLILRVDRLDPAKNPYRGFLAYERLLEMHPELKGKVLFLALLVPTKSDIPVYQEYQAETHELVEAINKRQGNLHWKPIRVLFEHNRVQALAALSLYDVLLVNSIADGMNLVAKEGPLLNRHEGVLVLSRRAGAYDDLAEGAIGIDPFDVDATAEALYQGLTMPAAERHRRAEAMRATIQQNDLKAWFQRLLSDIEEHAGRGEPAALS